MNNARTLNGILSTTDFHSALPQAGRIIDHLAVARLDHLIVDCGDFFEGTGHYLLGRGRPERKILTGLYDVVAPGNHGWRHHLEDERLRRITVCANVVDTHDRPRFRPLHHVAIAGRRVAVTGVIGQAAFATIPGSEREGLTAVDPVKALRALLLAHHHIVDTWVLLSHAGVDHDRNLAGELPFFDVIFSGHCHSDMPEPVRVGATIILKGRELGRGFAAATPAGADRTWTGATALFADSTAPPAPRVLPKVRREIAALGERLHTDLGRVRPAHHNRVIDRSALIAALAATVHAEGAADVVLLNETALRATRLGTRLTGEALAEIEPFGNTLVTVSLPPDLRDLHALIQRLTPLLGPLVVQPAPPPPIATTVTTTSYLAAAHLPGATVTHTGPPIADVLRLLLTTPGDSR
ncbi:bifunctional metallophosphatase/5'-nucleotidase (plasmid) [Streptomyces sp. BI20]|uniref:bifunctional metallophosphatase/5'-nucleotidase n=1 Tax=Streptomyces sp. BI20 TaxID=3403460 RepID=UPI003C796069